MTLVFFFGGGGRAENPTTDTQKVWQEVPSDVLVLTRHPG